MNKLIYDKYDENSLRDVDAFCNEYKRFISQNKTERECINSAIDFARKNGFKCLSEVDSLKAGDKVYINYMNKSLMLFVAGNQSITNGINFLGAHVDSPRLDIKSNALYEDSGVGYLDTHYYGGIKKYQWLTIPLALHGVVVKKDGKVININIGDKANDPVFAISDLLPHLDKDPVKKPLTGENLNIIAGIIPDEEKKDKKVKANLLKILKSIGIEEEDFFSAEIEAVPAGVAKDLGLDKSMIIGYGQDDRVCAYSSLKAIAQLNNPERCCGCILIDKEEIGSQGASSMSSRFFENSVVEIAQKLGEYTELNVRRTLANSYMISSDVTAAFDPNNAEPSNINSDAFLGRGIAFCKFTGSKGKYDANDANPEYIAKIRDVLDSNNVYYQFSEMGKVDAGGGGTIAFIMANLGMSVIDAGVPVLNMHAPQEITCKVDIFEAYKCYKAFLKSDLK